MKTNIAIFFLILFSLSCSPKSDKQNPIQPASGDSLAIASFNIQVFGQSKLEKEEVMSNIVKIISQFDIVAIQEIRSSEQNVMPTLVSLLGDKWDFTISERLGRTTSKEQYAFVYRKDKVKIDSTKQLSDPDDLLHREPFVCFAKAGKFDFCLINIHTDPDEVKQEVNALDDVMKQMLLLEKDAILLGDLNASPSEFDEILLIPKIGWAINDGNFTNVRLTATYDNLIFVQDNLKEYIASGVYNYKTILGLTSEQALEVSDHFPVYMYVRLNEDDD